MPITPTTASDPMTTELAPSDGLYLASQSPRRQQLLGDWGVAFTVLAPDPDEDVEALEQALPGEAPARYVRRVTQLKLRAALLRVQRRGLPSRPVLCADTTVALGCDILGKPETASDARETLGRLSGRSHRVLTAVAVGQGDRLESVVSTSWVRFADLSPSTIDAYVASGEPFGKAGAYGIQGLAALWISHLSGSYSGVMGLPAFETAQLVKRFGISTRI